MDPTLCQPPPDLDRWVRYAAEFYADVRECVGFVMHQTNGRANPRQVHEAIERLRRTDFPIHLIEWPDSQDTLTYCDDGSPTSNAVGPKSDNARMVTCTRCIDLAQASAEELAAVCIERRIELNRSA